MTKKEKQLLFKDLCGRLHCGVIVHTENGDGHLCSINQTLFGVEYGVNINPVKRDYFNEELSEIKPYLRSMSSMTKEEDKDWQFYKSRIAESCNELLEQRIAELYDWFNFHHFDYHGLILMKLAIEAPKDMYK